MIYNKNPNFDNLLPPQIDRLEQNCGQLQINLAQSHQRHKEEVRQLEEHIATLDGGQRQSLARCTALEQEIGRKEEQIKRNEGEIKAFRLDVANKTEEVGGNLGCRVGVDNFILSIHICKQK